MDRKTITIGEVSFSFENESVINRFKEYFPECNFYEKSTLDKATFYIEPAGQYHEDLPQKSEFETQNIFGSTYQMYYNGDYRLLASPNNKYGPHLFKYKENCYQVYYLANNTGDDIKWTIRLCRELLFNYYIERGYIPIHASAVSYNGLGILAIGERGSGKTTTMCTFSNRLGAKVISNDLVLVGTRECGSIELVGWPWKIAVGNALAKKMGYTPDSKNLKVEIMPHDFCNAFNCRWKWREKASIILLPKVNAVDLLSSEKVEIQESIDFIKNHGIEYHIFNNIFNGKQYCPRLSPVIDKLSTVVPCYYLRGNIWDDYGRLRTIINEILASNSNEENMTNGKVL